jgi:peptidoglycan hydrolase-like protein with peptidoglycan-binding domain
VARVSYFKPAITPEGSAAKAHRRLVATGRPRRWGRFVAGGALLLLLAAAAVVLLVFVSAKASLTEDSVAIARVGMPLGGGKIESINVVTGPHAKPVPVSMRGDQIWPSRLISAHKLLQIEVVVKRPGWISWLAGSTQRLRLTIMTPSASLREHYLTLKSGAAIKLRFKQPVRTFSYGPPGHLVRRVLRKPLSEIRLKRTSTAGTTMVAAAPRSWETSKPAVVSWFPAGSAASAVSNPAPGAQITPHTKITLTFNKTISAALGSSRPPVSPTTPGTWHVINPHTMTFQPEGYGYGLGAHVSVALPKGVQLVGGQASATSDVGNWTVPAGSTLRLQQLLADLGYLPLSFKGRHVAATAEAQEAAAIKPPKGSFDWRYPNTPDALKSMWAPGTDGTMTRGALMAFENEHGLTTDGVAGAGVWKALIDAAVSSHPSTFGYTFVMVNRESSPQSLTLWHSGKTVLTTAVNTGIASAPTAAGTFPVFEHLRVTTMSGTNPDGSHYSDPGIQYVSYFNGGDALHAFTRAQFGFPQSLGCVEMELGSAGQVWPYTPIGTLVHVI